MTVDELREHLRHMPGDMDVYLEDECCGCSNLVDHVMVSDVNDPDNYVAITG